MNRRPKAPARTPPARPALNRACRSALGALWIALCLPAGGAARDIHATRPSEPASESAAIEEARALVQQLQAMQPAENAVQDGVLRIWEGRKLRSVVPVRCTVRVTPAHWLSVYETFATNAAANLSPTQRLTVTHRPDAPNLYELELCEASGVRSRTLRGEELMTPFAGSDFWIADLGLEFLRWPEQKVLRHEMKRGQSCVVLESRRPGPDTNGYVRVVSWIDRDTGGIVQAEAFDARERKLKEFAPKSFKKVRGQWQLQEMEIRNLQTGSRTRLEFALSASETMP
jgi:hypothetical protein